MTKILTILTIPNPILRQRSEPAPIPISGKVKVIAIELQRLLSESPGAAAIAAPQIGCKVRMFVYKSNPLAVDSPVMVVINPELVHAKEKCIVEENCLSIPGKFFFVERYKMVKLKGLTLDGEVRIFKGTGMVAQILEHELDHLDGILIDKKGRTTRY